MSFEHNSTKDSSMPLNKRKRRLKFRCWHRGSREADLLLGNFADEYLPGMDMSDIEDLERISDSSDQEIWGWITGTAPVPLEINLPMIDNLKSVYTNILKK